MEQYYFQTDRHRLTHRSVWSNPWLSILCRFRLFLPDMGARLVKLNQVDNNVPLNIPLSTNIHVVLLDLRNDPLGISLVLHSLLDNSVQLDMVRHKLVNQIHLIEMGKEYFQTLQRDMVSVSRAGKTCLPRRESEQNE